MNRWILGFRQQLLGIALGNHGLFLGIQKHGVVPDGKNAGQVVGDHHHRGAQTFTQLENQVIQQPGADGVQSGRRFIEKKDLRIQGHGPGQPGPLLHPPLISDG